MSALGLNRYQRARSRRLAVRAAYLLLNNAPLVHYTQDSRRWQGISLRKRSYRGEFPSYSDCSSSTTWCLWDATRRYRLPDFVNNADWKAGYTGTQVDHGVRVGNNEKLLRADLAFYGDQGGGVPKHVAIVVKGGKKPLVISHGSEGGPYLLPLKYRSDFVGCRRYIR